MAGKTMEERVTDLEKLAETLAPLPAQVAGLTERMAAVELQNVQLRSEMHAGFSAIRGEMADMKAELRDDIAAQGRDTAERLLELRSELRLDLRTELRTELATGMRTLREDLVDRIVTGDEETRRQMRVLHEELIDRLARLGEGR